VERTKERTKEENKAMSSGAIDCLHNSKWQPTVAGGQGLVMTNPHLANRLLAV